MAAKLAEKIDEEEEIMSEDELLDTFWRSIESLHRKAKSLQTLAKPLQKECRETAELAELCEEAAGEI